MLIDVKKYSPSLRRLWAEAFGDDEEYAGLLFNEDNLPCECFAEIADGQVVSVLYLLESEIRLKGKVFCGRYLYAAATADSYRKKGLMAGLIRQAQEYVREKGLSFISLVPADEGLYGYYSRFGFEAVMSNYRAAADDLPWREKGEEMSPEAYFAFRDKLDLSGFSFSGSALRYALSCLVYSDYEFLSNSDDSCYILSAEGGDVLEYISSEENFAVNTHTFLSRLGKNTDIVSPYDLSDFCQCSENKFGMAYITDDEMKNILNDKIYMNIALD